MVICFLQYLGKQNLMVAFDKSTQKYNFRTEENFLTERIKKESFLTISSHNALERV